MNEIKNKIVLEGEAEYKRALAEITRELKENKSAVRAAAAEMDAADGSTEALRRHGEALEKTLGTQRNALSLMQQQLDKVERAYGKNSREATELRTKINNMRTEVARSENELKRFTRSLENVEDAADDAGDGLMEAGEGFGELGDGARDAGGEVDGLGGLIGDLDGMSLGGVIGAFGALAGAAEAAGSAMAYGDDVTRSFNLLAGYTGATGEELAALQEAAKILFKHGFGESLSEAAGVIATVHTHTGLIGDDLVAAAEGALMLSEIFGFDMQESARSAKRLMDEFGLSGQEAYDLIASAAQNGADVNGNLLDTINEYAGYFSAAGKGAEEFAGALASAAENGVYDVGKVGDAMKEFVLRIGDGSDTTKTALQGLGLLAEDIPGKFAKGGETASAAFDLVVGALSRIEDPLERNRLGTMLFRTQWEDTGGAVLDVFLGMEEGAQDATGALEAMSQTRIDDLGVQTDGLKGRFALALGEITQPFTSGLANFLAEVSEAADTTGSTWIDALAMTIGQKSGIALDAMGTVLGVGEESPVIEAAKSAGTLAGEAWGESFAQKIAEAASDPNTEIIPEPVTVRVDELLQLHSDAAGSGDTALAAQLQEEIEAEISAAVQALKAGKKQITIDDLFAARSQAAGEGDLELVAELDAVIEEAIAATREGGENAGQALIDGWASKTDATRKAAQESADAAVGAIEVAAGDMEAAGSTWIDALAMTIGQKSGTALDAMGTVLGVGEESPVIEAAKSAGTLAGEAWGESFAQKIAEAASDPNTEIMPEPVTVRVDELLQLHSDAAGSGDAALAAQLQEEIEAETSAAVQALKAGKKQITIDDLFAARSQAAGEGDLELVAELDAVIEEAIAATREGGENAGQALIDGWASKTDATREAAQESADAAVGAIEDAAGDMEAAGSTLGGSGVSGTQSGLDGMYGAGVDGADGLVAGLGTGIRGAYDKGYAAGKAYERGYRAATRTASPSRLMMEAAGDTTDGLLVRFDEDQERVRAAGEALGEQVAAGYRAGAAQTGAAAAAGGPVLDQSELAAAVRGALEGMAVLIDGERVGELTELGVSRTQTRRAAGTIGGQGTRLRSL